MSSVISNIRRKAALSLTNAAKSRLNDIISKKSNTLGIRIGVRTRGCNGLSYTMNFIDKVNKLDEYIKEDNINIYIEPKSLLYLVGTTMDYVDTETVSEFVFVNPNAKSKCGCGESFNV